MSTKKQLPSAWTRLGQHITRIREEKEMSVRGLARAVGVAPSHISRLEKGTVGFSHDSLESIAKALGVKVPELLDMTDGSTKTLVVARIPILLDPEIEGFIAGEEGEHKTYIHVDIRGDGDISRQFAIHLDTDALSPKVPQGAHLIIDSGLTMPKGGKLYLGRVGNGQWTVGEWASHAGQQMLRPVNRDYPSLTGKKIEIAGQVIGAVCKL